MPASKTSNVRVGVCNVFFGGVDLGYTQGGVEVSVSTDTNKVEVDQFGKSPISETITGRMVSVKAPLAESTLANLNLTFPGSTIVATGGAFATGTITVTTNPTAADTMIVNGATVSFVSAVTDASLQVLIGANAGATAVNLAAFINSTSALPPFGDVTAGVAGSIVTLTSKFKSTDQNSFTLVTGTAGAKITMSGATLSGGTNPTSQRVDVTDGLTASDLLASAKELRLHPINRGSFASANYDYSEDFVIPLANTAGALTFAYKLEDERIYNVEFNGYPDATTRRLFYIGK
jgi:hypothetical protein